MKKLGKRIAAFALAMMLLASTMPQQDVFAAELIAESTETEATASTEPELSTETSTEISTEAATEIEAVNENKTDETDTEVSKEDSTEDLMVLEDTEDTEEEMTALINYAAIDNAYIQAPGTQNVVVSIGDENTVIDGAILTYTNETSGVEKEVSASNLTPGVALFTMNYADAAEQSVYRLDKIRYAVAGEEYGAVFAEIGLNIRYGVNMEIKTSPDSTVINDEEEQVMDDAKLDIVTTDADGNQTSADSIASAIDEVRAEVDGGDGNGTDGICTDEKHGNAVVVLDPGHGGSDSGTSGNGLVEKNLTLKIAMYCKAELEKYKGVTVYMTRTTDTYVGLDERTTMAKNWGANVFVSIHVNQNNNTSANGVEIYYPNQNYNATISAWGLSISQKILSQLTAIGLGNRGTKIRDASSDKYADGSAADYYSVIRTAKQKNIPGIIVEHAFISNTSDVSNYLNTDAKLQKLGVADAKGIADYFSLGTQGKLSIDSIGLTAKKSGVTIKTNYTTSASSVQFRYLYYDVNAQKWGVISEWTTSSTVKWRPKVGNYWIQVAALDSNGIGVTSTTTFNTSMDYTQPFVELSGICYQINTHSIDIGAGYESDDPNVQFNWKAYNLDTKQWSVISGWQKSNWSTWCPAAGNYWLHVEAVTTSGATDECTINFHASDNYNKMYVDLTGICYQVKDTGIDVGVAYSSNDSGVAFKWQAYNLATKQWESISDWTGGNWATWKPQAGDYWLHVEAKTSTGSQVQDYTISFRNTKSYTASKLTLSGICYQVKNTGVDVGVDYSTPASSAQFKWLAYNLDTKQWSQISDWNDGNWATWIPEKGNYWLQVQAKDANGQTADYTICYKNDKDYNGSKYVTVSGVCVQQTDACVKLGAAFDSNDPGVAFQWQIYDLSNGSWTTITDWTGSNWTSWYPYTGKYWVYVTAKTSDGKTTSFCQGVDLKVGYTEIMGDSQTTLSKMIKYYNSNAKYPAAYANTDAPTITDFCNIYLEECKTEGVRAEVAFAQAMKETNFLKFGGSVSLSQNNFANLGSSYATVRYGVRAQVQHLKAFASTAALNGTCIDNEFSSVARGSAQYVEWLGTPDNPNQKGWSGTSGYGADIKNSYMKKLLAF